MMRARFACTRRYTFLLSGLALAVFASGCATKQTRVATNEERAFGAAPKVEINKETIVVDARPAFEYSTNHVPQSVNLNWADFTEAEPAQRGIIQNDVFGAARRLARAGIAPDSKVVVLGKGLQGSGEEGRIAWMLAYLGVTDVQFAPVDSLKPRLTNEPEATPPKGAAIWKPTVNESLNATKAEVLFAINERGVDKPVSFKGAPARLYRLIDVRSERAYLGKEGIGAIKHVPNMDAINIPWKQFFSSDMRPNEATFKQLRAMGFASSDRLVVLDENGISSAAVTMALRQAGFANAANYSGGLQDLIP